MENIRINSAITQNENRLESECNLQDELKYRTKDNLKRIVNNKKFGISGSVLKLIAIITMAIDHTAATFYSVGKLDYNTNQIMRTIGRFAFPIFCFLLVEGFLHTRNRTKYAMRLAMFAIISEVPFDLAFADSVYFIYYQNVFFTLLIGFVALMFIDKFKEKEWIGAIIGIAAIILANFLKTDYGSSGVILILLIYLSRRQLARISASIVVFAYAIMGGIETYAIFSLIPINLYNGKRGFQLKYFFYIFYPTHLLLLYYLSHYVVK